MKLLSDVIHGLLLHGNMNLCIINKWGWFFDKKRWDRSRINRNRLDALW